jgi:hypothetical protein
LGESHRGGKRVRKKPKLEDGATSAISPAPSQTPTLSTHTPQAPQSQTFHSSYDTPPASALTWHTPISATAATSEQIAGGAGPRNHDDIASADLQNPSDALEILAQVADRADEGETMDGEHQGRGLKRPRPTPGASELGPPKMDDQLHYRPVQDGMIAPEMIYHLFSRSVVRQYRNQMQANVWPATKNSSILIFL